METVLLIDGSRGKDYRDVSLATHPLSERERNNVLTWMQEEKYSKDAIRTVENSFNRLLAFDSDDKDNS